MERFDRKQMGVVDDGDDGLASGVLGAGLGDEARLAFAVAADGVEFEGLTEQAHEVGPGVQRAVDDGRDPLFGIVADDGVFEDGFAGAGFAEDEAEPALLAVDLENVEVALLVFEERGVFVDDEGVVAETEVASDHGGGGVWMLDAADFGCVGDGGGFVRTRCRVCGHWRPCRV